MPTLGAPPEGWRQVLPKLCWTLVYMLYLGTAVGDLSHGGHGPLARALGWTGLIGFVVVYLTLVVLPRPLDRVGGTQLALIGLLLALAVALSATLGPAWLVLFVYVSVCAGVLFPLQRSGMYVPGVTLLMLLVGAVTGAGRGTLFFVGLPCLLGGAAMLGVQAMIRTLHELREARETVAHLAASDERLRMARDLHDLLGHSLALITLKSELAGRMLPEQPDAAAKQVADIERVSRQALVDVREAVTGFRRPTLAVEVAGVRTTLRTARIEARLDASLDSPEERERLPLAPEQEGALAWALREAVTNVVRHSRATRCEVSVDEVWDDEGRFACLEVLDNGVGIPRGRPHGNGLTGLSERLLLSGGRLETGTGPRGKGFRLRALVPLRAAVAVGEG
jgi:two-component system, NarL family, sensor histidine kinase DesK